MKCDQCGKETPGYHHVDDKIYCDRCIFDIVKEPGEYWTAEKIQEVKDDARV